MVTRVCANFFCVYAYVRTFASLNLNTSTYMIRVIINDAVEDFRRDFGGQENYETLERIYVEGMIKAFTAVFDMQLHGTSVVDSASEIINE